MSSEIPNIDQLMHNQTNLKIFALSAQLRVLQHTVPKKKEGEIQMISRAPKRQMDPVSTFTVQAIPAQSVTTNPPRNQSLRKGFGRKYTPLPMFLAELFPILVKAHKLAPRFQNLSATHHKRILTYPRSVHSTVIVRDMT